MENTISLCMIVKDEENLLGKCLESIIEFVDELIIVDTGSTDTTKEVALSYGAQVYDFNWNSDFSEARNFAKEKATKNWILQLDADEYFEKEEAVKIRELLQGTDKQAFLLKIINLRAQNRHGSIHSNIRLFKNTKDISYVHRIHEQPHFKGNTPMSIQETDITILHAGYLKEIIESKNKGERNLAILLAELKHNPNDRFTLLNIGSEYLAAQNYDKAMYYYQKATKKEKDVPMLQKAILKMAICYEQAGRDAEALRLLKKGKSAFKEYTDLYFLEGEILQKLGREKDAQQAFEQCLALGEPKSFHVSNQGVGTTLPMLKLAKMALNNRDLATAAHYYSQALTLNKYLEDAALSLFGLLKNSGEKNEALASIHALYADHIPKDLVFKYKLFSELWMEEELLKTTVTLKNALDANSIPSDALSNFHYHLLIADYPTVELLLDNPDYSKEEQETKRYLYCHFHPDKSLVGTLRDDLHNAELKPEVYVNLLFEFMRFEEYQVVTDLLDFSGYFDKETLTSIANVFYLYLRDDLAIEYLLKSIEQGNDNPDIYLRLAELLSRTEFLVDAISYAELAFNTNNTNFKPIEIIIDSYVKLGEVDAAINFAKEMLDHYSQSNYLASFTSGQ